jgi:hypothetical protein
LKTKQAMVAVSLTVVVAGTMAWVLISQPRAIPVAAGGALPPVAAKPEAPIVSNTAPPEGKRPAVLPPTLVKSDVHTKNVKPAEVAPAGPPIIINGYELQDPLARIALNFVGSDPDADAYWIGAINDDSLPAEERKDLIEDLNEDGLSDPRHPTAQDLPLILSRLRLIERLTPTAMDSVNRDAFAEAYKDLVGLANGQEPQ